MGFSFRSIFAPIASAVEQIVEQVKDTVEEAAKTGVSDALAGQLAEAAGYVGRKKSKFTAAIEKEWKRRGLTTANKAAADAAVDAVVNQIL